MQEYTSKAMAGSLNSEISGNKRSEGHFEREKLLLIPEIYSILQKEQNLYKGRSMLSYMDISHEFHYMQVPFPITKVQHVTTEECMSDILDSQCFRASSRRKDFKDLSFWSVHIPKDNVNTAFEEAYKSLPQKFDLMYLSQYTEGIKDQFANSPAFKNFESRYGNFMFSFSLSYLLALYKTQHCGEKKPLFKCLGTHLFKKEIVHYIVIHSPDSDEFDDLQQVPKIKTAPSLNTACYSYPVYRAKEKLYWRPESTSDELNVLFLSHELAQNKRYCVWNHLVFAFHLPEGSCLQIPGEQLLKNLSACRATEIPYLGETKTTREKATEIIESKKRHYQCEQKITDGCIVKLQDE